jgi:hypothetical protein
MPLRKGETSMREKTMTKDEKNLEALAAGSLEPIRRALLARDLPQHNRSGWASEMRRLADNLEYVERRGKTQ